MASISLGQKYVPHSSHRENPLIPIANRLIDELGERHRLGLTKRRRIGLAGGNPSQIHVDSVMVRWNCWKRSADRKVADRRQRLTVVDGHGRVPTREFLLPHSAEVQEAVIKHVKSIWASRDTEDVWFYQI